MKVMLMVPPARDALTLETSNDIAQNMGRFPPLGILYLAAYLRKHTRHEVRLLDAETEDLTVDAVVAAIRDWAPDVVGITAFTMTWAAVWAIAQQAKQVNPALTVVLGGPHLPLYWRETMELVPEVDYGVCGDGEEALRQLLTALEARATLPASEFAARVKAITGIVMRDGGDVYRNGFARMTELDAIPFPDRTMLPQDHYFCILGERQLGTTMMSSRGCPYRCTYCNTPDKVYRKRSPANIADEMAECLRLGIEEIFFFDDLFNLRAADVIALCDEIVRRGLRVKWAFRGRVNGVTEEMMRKLKAAGCTRIQFGIEKADDAAFRTVQKETTVAEVENAVRLTKKYGLMAVGNFLIGTPGETREDILRIIRFSLELPLDFAEYSIFIPFPGTAIYADGLRSGFFTRDHWLEYVRKPDKNFRLFWNEKLDLPELLELHTLAHKRFYFRPRIMIRTLLRIRTFADLQRKLRGALIMVRL